MGLFDFINKYRLQRQNKKYAAMLNGFTPIFSQFGHDIYDIIEYSLATININQRTESITAAMITDTRLDSSVCGMVQGLIQQVSTETLYNQWKAAYEEAMIKNQNAFDTWFQNIKNTLTASARIRAYRNRVITESMTTNANIGIIQYVKELDILEVYVNGFRLDTAEYTIDSSGINVTFTNALDTGAVIEFVVYKTMEE